MSDRVLSLVAEGEATHALPMPVIVYFFITFALFLVALGVTWAFRNTGYRFGQAKRAHQRAAAAAQARADEHGSAH